MSESAELADTKSNIKEPVQASKYTPDELEQLTMWEAIRKRPGMYIGSTGPSGLHLLAYELVHLSLDEFRAGFCNNIIVTIHIDGSLSIVDDGRPPARTEATTFLTDYTRPSDISPHGRGLSTGFFFYGSCALVYAAALSAWLICEIRDGKRRWQTHCEASADKGPDFWQDIGACPPGKTGIRVHFLPDPTIFVDTTWDNTILMNWIWEQVHLYPGLAITFTDEHDRCGPQVFCAPDGLAEMLPWCLDDKTLIHSTIIAGTGIHEGVHVELSLSFIAEEPTWRMYGCGLPLEEGGTPLTGLRIGLARTLGELAGRTGISFQPEKARLGIAAIVSVWLDQPIYGGPSKDRLENPEAEVAVARVVRDALLDHARQHPDEMQAILAAL